MHGEPDTTTELRTDLPPGPDLPGWLVAKLWIESPVELWEECSAKHGEEFTIELGSIGTTVLFSRPEAVRQIFKLPADSFVSRAYNGYSGTVMGDHAIFRADGAEHRRKRRLVVPELNRRPMHEHAEAVRGLVGEMLEALPEGEAFAPRPPLHLLSLKFMLGIALGGTEGDLSREIVRVFSEEIYTHFGSWSPWARFVNHHGVFRELISAEIRKLRERPGPAASSLLEAMARTRDESGAYLEDEEIQDHLFTTFIVGVDPAAIALSWALYWLHANPEVLDRLRGELAGLGPDLDPQRVIDLPYLSAVLDEVLRMYPIPATPAGRKLVVEATIDGRLYPPGVTLLPCTYLVHRREDIYPDPHRFRPERFLDRRYGPHEYFPFGGGARTCIGATLAPREIKLVLAEILSRSELSPAHDGPVRPVRHGTLLAPSDALKFIVRRSSGPASANGVPREAGEDLHHEPR